jgi:uncharacterized delta-60 repeat protein
VGIRTTMLLATALAGAIIAGPGQSASASATCGLDTSFGTNGVLSAPDYTLDYGHAVTVDAQGRYLVAGEAGSAFAVMRLLPSGELDTSFGSGSGLVTVRHDAVYGSEAWDVMELADGRIAVAGRAYWAVSPTSWGDIAVAVLNPDGSPDTAFGGGDGVTYLDLGEHNDLARSIDVDAAGRIVVGGSTAGSGAASNAVLVRLLPDGSPDPAFGVDGYAVQSLGGSYEAAYGIDVLADGRILAAGSWQADIMQPWLGRFLADGTPDASFGQAGLVLPAEPGSWQDVAAGPRGSVLVGGSDGLDLVVARYTSNGGLDRAYGGGDGKATVAAGQFGPYPSANGLAVLGDGSVLAAGAATRTGYSEGVIVRLDPRGFLDRNFGTGGVIRYSEDPQYSSSSFSSVAALAGGGAVVAGGGYAGAIVARTC